MTTNDPRILSPESVMELKQQYSTPPHMRSQILDIFERYGIDDFDLDVAASEYNRQAVRFYNATHDGLAQSWLCRDHTAAWCNPPFKQLMKWQEKAWAEALYGHPSCVVSLNDPSTEWFALAHRHATAVIVIPERINYIPHPEYVAHLEATGGKLGGNSGTNLAWLWVPCLIDRPGGAEWIYPTEWKRARDYE